jgi:hypothetical protein
MSAIFPKADTPAGHIGMVSQKEINKWLSRPYAELNAAERRREELWDALNEFVRQQKGWITSPPGRHIRIEYPEGGALPLRLAEAGYKLRFCAGATRNVAGEIVRVDVVETTLPGR